MATTIRGVDNFDTAPEGLAVGKGNVYRAVSTSRTVFSTAVSGGAVTVPDLQLTVTPVSVNSHFVIFFRIFGETASTSVADHTVSYYIARNGSPINIGNTGGANTIKTMAISAQGYYDNDQSSTPATTSSMTYDAPNTTSPVTYTIRQISGASTATSFVMNDARITTDSSGYEEGSSELIVMEIAQ